MTMANGHSPDRPKGQGDMGPVHTSQPTRVTDSGRKAEPGKTPPDKGVRVKPM